MAARWSAIIPAVSAPQNRVTAPAVTAGQWPARRRARMASAIAAAAAASRTSSSGSITLGTLSYAWLSPLQSARGAALRSREADPRPLGRRSPRHPASAPHRLRQPRRLRAAVAGPGHPQRVPGGRAGRGPELPARAGRAPGARAPGLDGAPARADGRAAPRAGRRAGGRGDQVGAARRPARAGGARVLRAPGAALRLDDAQADGSGGRRGAGADRDRRRRGRARAAERRLRRPRGGGAAAAQLAPPPLRERARLDLPPARRGGPAELPLPPSAPRTGGDPGGGGRGPRAR